MKYIQTFRVRGGGQFPFDMLRYDQCFPSAETESPLLGLRNGEYRQVELQRYTETAKDYPTVGRWLSFGWQIIESSITVRKLR